MSRTSHLRVPLTGFRTLVFVLSLIFIFGVSLVETAGDGALVALTCHRRCLCDS